MMTDGTPLTTSESPWWAKLLDRFGFPTFMLLVLLYFSYVSVTWLSANIWTEAIIPLRDSHLQLIESVRSSNEKMGRQIELQTTFLSELSAANRLLIQSNEEINQTNQVLIEATREGNALLRKALKQESTE